MKIWRAAFPDFHFTIEDTIVQGNKVVMRIPFNGTHDEYGMRIQLGMIGPN